MNKEFTRGFKSIFSLTPNNRISKKILALSTEERIRQNWENVGNDIKKSMDKIDTRLSNSVKKTS